MPSIEWIFAVLQMANIYDSSQGLIKIGPCKWSPNLDIAFWLSQNDDTILKVRDLAVHLILCYAARTLTLAFLSRAQYLSTSPMAEPPHFVQHIKSTIQFFLKHPNSDSLFPGGQPQLYRRTAAGDWERVVSS